jgi:hypothetical protein
MPRASSASRKPSLPPSRPSHTPTVQHSVEVKQPGFFSNVFQGFALGAGQSLAFNMFRSDPVVKHEHIQVPSKEYQQCMKENNNDEYCAQYKSK